MATLPGEPGSHEHPSPLRSLAFGLGTAALLLLLLEGLLRLVVPETALLFLWERPDGYLLWENHVSQGLASEDLDAATQGDWLKVRPDLTWTECTASGLIHFQTESHGFRAERPVTPKPEGDDFRVLALGDSWIFGIAQSQGETVPERLEAGLSQRLGRGVEVVNGGVPGSSGFDMLRRWRSVYRYLEFDALVLGRPHNYLHHSTQQAAQRAWYETARGAPYLNARIYLLLRRGIAPLMRSPFATLANRDVLDSRGAGLGDIQALVAEAQELAIPTYFYLFPEPFTHRDPDHREVVARGQLPDGLDEWVEGLSPYGVRFFGHNLPERQCWGSSDPTHPGAGGAFVLGEGMAEVITTGVSAPLMTEAPSCPDLETQRPPCQPSD